MLTLRLRGLEWVFKRFSFFRYSCPKLLLTWVFILGTNLTWCLGMYHHRPMEWKEGIGYSSSCGIVQVFVRSISNWPKMKVSTKSRWPHTKMIVMTTLKASTLHLLALPSHHPHHTPPYCCQLYVHSWIIKGMQELDGLPMCMLCDQEAWNVKIHLAPILELLSWSWTSLMTKLIPINPIIHVIIFFLGWYSDMYL